MGHLRDRIAGLTGVRRVFLLLLCGAVLALAQPPVSFPWVIFVVLPVLFWQFEGARRPWSAFGVGWFAGTGYFAASLFWIIEPFLVEPEIFGWMAPFALAGMAGGLALFWAVPFFLVRRLGARGFRAVAFLALAWSIAEFARSNVLTGFPWGLLAYTWIETPVMQVAAVLGPHGLGMLTVLAGLVLGLLRPGAVAFAAMLLVLGWGYGAWRLGQPEVPPAQPTVVRVVQPNAEQHLKWDPEYQEIYFQRLLDATQAPAEVVPDLVIWPETAVPFTLDRSAGLQVEVGASLAPGSLLALGIQRMGETAEGADWFNSLAVLDGSGQSLAVYDKHHLVPFGEYVPMQSILGLTGLTGLTGSGFRAGPGPKVIDIAGIPAFLPLICYEAIFPQGLRTTGARPEWLLQVTNDAWFGKLSGPYQHLAQARVRAIEQGLPLVRAANTGISAVVDSRGRLLNFIVLGENGYFDAQIPATSPQTLYSQYGESIFLASLLLVFALTLYKIDTGISRSLSR